MGRHIGAVRWLVMSGAPVAVIVAGYLLGTFPTAVLVGRRHGFDPTVAGSGNPGASNATRVGGWRAGAAVLVGDAGKGVLAAALGFAADGRALGWLAGAAAVAGHVWPITRGLRGGKGVATALGVVALCAPLVAVPAVVIFGVLVKVFRIAAVGSLVVTALVPVGVAATGQSPLEVATAAGIAVAIVVRHRANIARLATGEESAVVGEHERDGRDAKR